MYALSVTHGGSGRRTWRPTRGGSGARWSGTACASSTRSWSSATPRRSRSPRARVRSPSPHQLRGAALGRRRGGGRCPPQRSAQASARRGAPCCTRRAGAAHVSSRGAAARAEWRAGSATYAARQTGSGSPRGRGTSPGAASGRPRRRGRVRADRSTARTEAVLARARPYRPGRRAGPWRVTLGSTGLAPLLAALAVSCPAGPKRSAFGLRSPPQDPYLWRLESYRVRTV